MKHLRDITLPEVGFSSRDIEFAVKSIVAHPDWAILGPNLSVVLGQMRDGTIHSTRRAEIGIIGAGKV